MTTSTLTLTSFLLARIAEDEAAARAAAEGGERWMTTTVHGPIVVVDDGTEHGGYPVVYDEGQPSEAQAGHIARHDPARVLAEVEAKRRIVEHCEPDLMTKSPGDVYVLQLLASVYADHPDFREEWRP